jgi:hypothetical protein
LRLPLLVVQIELLKQALPTWLERFSEAHGASDSVARCKCNDAPQFYRCSVCLFWLNSWIIFVLGCLCICFVIYLFCFVG